MPVSSVDVREGDPTVQASGQHRGTVDVTFDDGRILTLNLRAPDLDSWNDAVANAGAQAQKQMENQDAAESVDPDADVAANKEASIAQSCIAYIQSAWSQDKVQDAWDLYARINTYVTNHGGWATAKPALLAAGLTDEEYTQAETAYQYLSGSGRPAILAEATTIQANWEAQH